MIKSNIKQRLECLDINRLEKLIWKRGRFMKDGEFAIYLGKEYSAGKTKEGKNSVTFNRHRGCKKWF